ncbi:SRPBCC family protein [Neobacillus sp. FSL H8-0543]|uniref:SRPBCC family protein n=1 Tax=Neobacillus sp. FSL H8-0543 TaxID=2954672 RepID=UPI003158A163
MLAKVERAEAGYTARFEHHWNHSVQEVWSYLTDNEKLAKWFTELHVEELREGGLIKFNMQDGTFEELTIVELKIPSVLAYTWGDDIVHFELDQEPNGCRLVLTEKIKTITPHTPRDLAGWHVCLEVISALLDGRTIDSRKEAWNKWYEKYVQEIQKITNQ